VGGYISKTVESISKTKKKSEAADVLKEIEATNEEYPPAPHIIKVIQSSINIMQTRITQSRMAGDPPDIELAPKLRLDSFDFDKAQIGIEDGITCVETMLPAIRDAIHMYE
jgi:predicted acylesterase/phospholipase RssA